MLAGRKEKPRHESARDLLDRPVIDPWIVLVGRESSDGPGLNIHRPPPTPNLGRKNVAARPTIVGLVVAF